MFYISSNIIHYLKYIVYFTVYSPLLSCFVSYLFCFSSSSFICTSPVLFSVCLLCKFCCYIRKCLPFVRMHVCVCVILVSLNPRLQCSQGSCVCFYHCSFGVKQLVEWVLMQTADLQICFKTFSFNFLLLKLFFVLDLFKLQAIL